MKIQSLNSKKRNINILTGQGRVSACTYRVAGNETGWLSTRLAAICVLLTICREGNHDTPITSLPRYMHAH